MLRSTKSYKPALVSRRFTHLRFPWRILNERTETKHIVSTVSKFSNTSIKMIVFCYTKQTSVGLIRVFILIYFTFIQERGLCILWIHNYAQTKQPIELQYGVKIANVECWFEHSFNWISIPYTVFMTAINMTPLYGAFSGVKRPLFNIQTRRNDYCQTSFDGFKQFISSSVLPNIVLLFTTNLRWRILTSLISEQIMINAGMKSAIKVWRKSILTQTTM